MGGEGCGGMEERGVGGWRTGLVSGGEELETGKDDIP